jgi:hypothetical protein
MKIRILQRERVERATKLILNTDIGMDPLGRSWVYCPAVSFGRFGRRLAQKTKRRVVIHF